MSEPTLGEVYRLVRETREDVRDVREAVFVGHDGQPPILSRIATLEERTPRSAGVWAGIGSAVGAAAVVALSFFGIKPGQQ